MQKNSIFFKIIFSVGVILLLGLVAGGLAKFITFFNTGSNRATMLNSVPDLPNEYTPRINWLPDGTETGRKMEDFNRGIIARDFVRGLFQRNIVLKTVDTSGIKEYFTVDARPKVYALVRSYMANKKAIEKAEMNHNFKLHFYSADGQIASFTDYYVESRNRVIDLKTQQRIYSEIDTSNFKVVMILEDGFWRIKQLIRETPSELPDTLNAFTKERRQINIEQIKQIRGVNYYPKDTPWKEFWLKYDNKIIENDFEIIKKLNLNTIRVFINYEQFGKGNVVPEMLERLGHFLDTAQKNKIGVVVTLFDFNSNYQLLNFPATARQLEVIFTEFKNHPSLLAWDLKNEPDLDFRYQNESDVKEWLTFIIKQARKFDNVNPITIGWAYPENADLYANELDFVSFHYYKEVEELSETLKNLRTKIKGKTLLLEEFGLASYESRIFPFSTSEAEQARHLKTVKQLLNENGNIPFIYWTLYDFKNVGSDIAGAKPWQRNAQKHFGLLTNEGKEKQVAKVISGSNAEIETSWLDTIPSFLPLYVFLGLIFASTMFFINNLIRKFIKKLNS